MYLMDGYRRKIQNVEDIDYALIQYKKHKDQVDEYKEQRDRVIIQANEWLADVCDKSLKEMKHLETSMKDYYTHQLSEFPSLIVINRPFGKFGLIKTEDGSVFGVEVKDPQGGGV
ncbi:RNA processing factor Prp31 [Croceifilum oryzae]|uniref:RNA processing factor Prp31 n=1 Tax=Croceifilum oryzae TaxID=1553429 RepID=A0AAJ1WSN2_9BACL|nr:host-nuclease inhibitor Gam family protein [Croceifilum oryzae]MDQ0417895.1 RNA processing factor Prp31 [Croceifilum oryzae]